LKVRRFYEKLSSVQNLDSFVKEERGKTKNKREKTKEKREKTKA
jgi:hypothetical protein